MSETIKKIMELMEQMTPEQQKDELFRLEHKQQVNCVVYLEILSDGEVGTYEIMEQPWIEYDMLNDINDEVKELKESGIDITNSKAILLYSCKIDEMTTPEGTKDFDYYLDLVDYYIIEKDIDKYYEVEDIDGEKELPEKFDPGELDLIN
jgi:hypothetical protein